MEKRCVINGSSGEHLESVKSCRLNEERKDTVHSSFHQTYALPHASHMTMTRKCHLGDRGYNTFSMFDKTVFMCPGPGNTTSDRTLYNATGEKLLVIGSKFRALKPTWTVNSLRKEEEVLRMAKSITLPKRPPEFEVAFTNPRGTMEKLLLSMPDGKSGRCALTLNGERVSHWSGNETDCSGSQKYDISIEPSVDASLVGSPDYVLATS